MAVTKIHSVKATVNLTIEYICDEKKTDGKLLVSSFSCEAETADLEFEFTRKSFEGKSGKIRSLHITLSRLLTLRMRSLQNRLINLE